MSIITIGSFIFILLAFALSFLIVKIGSGMSGVPYWPAYFQLFPRYLIMMIPPILIGLVAQWLYVRRKKNGANSVEMPYGRKLVLIILTVTAFVFLNNILVSLIEESLYEP